MAKTKIVEVEFHLTLPDNLEMMLKFWRKYYPQATPPPFIELLPHTPVRLLQQAVRATFQGYGDGGTLQEIFADNLLRLEMATSADRVLISRDFYYFGSMAPSVPISILIRLGYKNGIGHRKFDAAQSETFLGWLRSERKLDHNFIVGDPFDFEQTGKRYSGKGSSLR